jgi:hypothetical protein
MNCFNNNRPKLSSSDRIKNKKAQAIFKSNVIDYQKRSTNGKGKCSNYKGNIGFYNNGKLRRAENHETLMNLTRGSALCLDGAYNKNINLEKENGIEIDKGLNACGKNNNVKITLGRDNVYTIFSGFSKDIETGNISSLFEGFPVLKSYFFNDNGTVNSSNNENELVSDFELQKKDYNSVVVVDPVNYLFGSNFCSTDMDNKTQGPNKYLQESSVNKFIMVQGSLYTSSLDKLTCDETGVSIHDFVGLGSEFVNTGDITKAIGVGYVFKKCCGVGINGESNWWTIYIRPLYLKNNTEKIDSVGFFKKIDINTTTLIVNIRNKMGLINNTQYPFVNEFGSGDPCKRNLHYGNNTQQNYLTAYNPISNKTHFNINSKIYDL